ncbi:MAG: hypothetical protein NT175_14170 [Bacteroidetes bacterium]|nr:hypothetical protein [Bacteroidota bacterium]
MKTKNLIFLAFITTMLSSCVSTYFFQVYKATPTDKITLKENLLIYEDDNCKVSYNLWDEGGNIGFSFFNKTDENIYLNLEESFFILNGASYNYYKNRIYTYTKGAGISTSGGATASKSVTGINYLNLFQTNSVSATNSVGVMASSGYSVSFNEEKIVCIPSMTSKVIAEYSINQSLYRDCDLFKYPAKKQISTKSFTISDSPLVFSNRVVYTVGQSGNPVRFENEYYISEITNYPQSEMFESAYDVYCGEKNSVLTYYFKNVSPDKFYLKYTKSDTWKH